MRMLGWPGKAWGFTLSVMVARLGLPGPAQQVTRGSFKPLYVKLLWGCVKPFYVKLLWGCAAGRGGLASQRPARASSWRRAT